MAVANTFGSNSLVLEDALLRWREHCDGKGSPGGDGMTAGGIYGVSETLVCRNSVQPPEVLVNSDLVMSGNRERATRTAVTGLSVHPAPVPRAASTECRTARRERTHWCRYRISAVAFATITQRLCSSTSAIHRGVPVVLLRRSHRRISDPGRSACYRGLGGCVHDGTTQQHNTHITDVREICYSWHPWHGRAVRVHASLVKRGQAVAYCSLEEVPA